MDKYVPGTTVVFKNSEFFEKYREMIELSGGISLNQICSMCNVETYTIQNWVKRGYIPRPINKKYFPKHLARVLLINSLKECMKIEDIGKILVIINGDVDDESDDIISEEDLYRLFSSIIYKLEDYDKVESIIDELVDDKQKKLREGLKIMVYAYISSEFSKKANEMLKRIEGGIDER